MKLLLNNRQFFIKTYVVIFVILIFLRNYLFITSPIFDRDRYVVLFNDYIKLGFYNAVSNGTSILFNLWNHLLFYIFPDTDIVFKLTNYISVIVTIVFGILILNKKNLKLKLETKLLFGIMFSCFMLDSIQIAWTNNDLFLTSFVMVLYWLLIGGNEFKYKGCAIGVVYAFMFSIRAFSILLLPILLYLMYYQKLFKFKSILGLLICFITVLLGFNYPSLLENGSLSFYDKNKNTYNVLNTLSTLDMFRGNTKINWFMRDIYNQSWSDEKIKFLTEKYKVESYSTNGISFMLNYPLEYFKLMLLNCFYLMRFFFKRYAFLILLPIYYLIMDIKSKNYLKNKNTLLISFLIGILSLLSILYCVIEFRWLVTFEFLLVIAIAISYNRFLKDNNVSKNLKITIFGSFILLGIFNVISIIKLIN